MRWLLLADPDEGGRVSCRSAGCNLELNGCHIIPLFSTIWGVCFRSADNPSGLDSRVLIRFGYGLLRDKLSASVCDRIVQAVSSMIRFSEFRHI